MKRAASALATAFAISLGGIANAGAETADLPTNIEDIYGHPQTGLVVAFVDGTLRTVETPPEARVSCYEAHRHARWQRECRHRKFRHRQQLVAWQTVLHTSP